MKVYIIGIVATAIMCAIVMQLSDSKTTIGRVLKLISGIIMTVAVISPITKITFRGVERYLDGLSLDADRYVSDGQAAAKENLSVIIKEQTETYILEKAHQMDLDISVEVVLDAANDQIPSAVAIIGKVTPYAKEALSNYIENTLGIRRENQKWM